MCVRVVCGTAEGRQAGADVDVAWQRGGVKYAPPPRPRWCSACIWSIRCLNTPLLVLGCAALSSAIISYVGDG